MDGLPVPLVGEDIRFGQVNGQRIAADILKMLVRKLRRLRHCHTPSMIFRSSFVMPYSS
jgi:hypothetical protein